MNSTEVYFKSHERAQSMLALINSIVLYILFMDSMIGSLRESPMRTPMGLLRGLLRRSLKTGFEMGSDRLW